MQKTLLNFGILVILLTMLTGCHSAKVATQKTVTEPTGSERSSPPELLNHPGTAPDRQPYAVPYTSDPINIDGYLDEPAWKTALPLPFFVFQKDTQPISATDGRLLWDDQYLYVGFRAVDKDVWSYMTERDDSTCREDVLEIFFNTHPGQTPYYNFEINALGTVYDAYSVQWALAGGTHRWKKWNCEGLRIGIRIRGTLNDWHDEDEGWDMEAAIPFSSLETIQGLAPEPGDIWTFHLARYDYSVYLPDKGREITSTTLFHDPIQDFHDVPYWGRLQFSPPQKP